MLAFFQCLAQVGASATEMAAGLRETGGRNAAHPFQRDDEVEKYHHQRIRKRTATSGTGRARTAARYVKSVFIVHVGGTRCVTSSTDNIMKIHARITLTVECIRTCIFLF